MKNIRAVFTIVEEKNCPLYETREQLLLSDKTLACPEGKDVCLILVRDMTELLFQFLQSQPVSMEEFAKNVYNCSGCSGLIKFSLLPADAEMGSNVKKGTESISKAIERIHGRAIESPLMRTFPRERIDSIMRSFQKIYVDEGKILIQQGKPNLHIFVVFEGELFVEDSGVQLARLAEGDVCGEISYLGKDVASSTVRAGKRATVLKISGETFSNLLGNCAAVQVFMAKSLAKRLSKSNTARENDFDACMSGKVEELLPAELFQIFHMHQKTGVLAMELPGGTGKVSFRQGCIINASYEEIVSQEAIFRILGERKGTYRFTTGLSPQDMKAAEIGDFMMLLMEGVRRFDEEALE